MLTMTKIFFIKYGKNYATVRAYLILSKGYWLVL